MELLIVIVVIAVAALNQAEAKKKSARRKDSYGTGSRPAAKMEWPADRSGRKNTAFRGSAGQNSPGTGRNDTPRQPVPERNAMPRRPVPERNAMPRQPVPERNAMPRRPVPSGDWNRPLPRTDSCEDTCKWSWKNRRRGEDELEALIRQNHEHEKHLEERLMVQEKRED